MLYKMKRYSAVTLSITFLSAITFFCFSLQGQAEGPRSPGKAPASKSGRVTAHSVHRYQAPSINQTPISRPGSTRAFAGESSWDRHFIDSRYQHNRSYPVHGQSFQSIPRDHRMIMHGHSRYYYHDGIWYRPHYGRYLVVAPPIGLFVPFLPFFYTTIYWNGIPYYYANQTYYTATTGGYVVVSPPKGEVSDTPPDGSNEIENTDENKLFIYPRNGQSEKQQSNDRYECHQWAAKQTNYDPTSISSGISPDDLMQKRSDYQRAIAACLDGRGYTVR